MTHPHPDYRLHEPEPDPKTQPASNQTPVPIPAPTTPQVPAKRAKTGSHAVFGHIRHPKKRLFLRCLVEAGTVVRAAKAAGVDRDTVYSEQWRGDAEFQAALQEAKVMAADLMEDEVYRRAVEGVERPTGWHKGEPGAYIRERSDLLLMFGLKAVKPEYRDQVEVRGAMLHVPDMGRLPQEVVRRLSEGEDPRLVLASLVPGLLQSGIIELRPRAQLPAARSTDAPTDPNESS